ncbi:MAG TPA: ABC transporter substrate-binding protein [Streptosporangiaceae bacterium]|jgi:polar amino acid transport system substrate-binding protein
MELWKRGGAAAAIVVSCAIALPGCAKNTEQTGNPTGPEAVATKDAKLAGLVPAAIAKKGYLKIGIGPNYSPNEYRDSSSKIVGWDVEIGDAMAAKLGLKAKYVESHFPEILSGLGTGTFDIGISSFTDTKEREKTVDFVDYFQAGTQWASGVDAKIGPDNACGKTVAAQSNTNQLLEYLPALSKKCVKAGKPAIKIDSYDDQTQATTAVSLGKADASAADSPVIAYAVKQSHGKLQLSGGIIDAAPYGIPIKKGSKLGRAMVAAFEALKKDGTYDKILKRWGVEAGSMDKFSVNGAA